MGWLRLKREHNTEEPLSERTKSNERPHLTPDIVISTSDYLSQYPRLSLEIADKDLPFIPAEVVMAQQTEHNKLWIVVDRVVYDCTSFISEHPGGSAVIESFRGKDCSWQFWRFHNVSHLTDHGRQLRIGKTGHVANPYKERPQYVGLRTLAGSNDDDW
jgi:cytochrome b involved in lipid metabolism